MKFKLPKAITPFALTVNQFIAAYPASRETVYASIRSGELESFTDGNRRLIPYKAARAFVARKAAAGSGAIPPEVRAQKSAAGRKGKAAQNAMRRESAA